MRQNYLVVCAEGHRSFQFQILDIFISIFSYCPVVLTKYSNIRYEEYPFSLDGVLYVIF